jgi:hypothetical protein
MKRLIIHLVVALITFFIGIFVKLALTESRPSAPYTNPQVVTLLTQNVPESSAAVNSASPMSEFTLDYDPEEFNPRGTYFILGREPKDLREFDCFELVVEERDDKASGDATLYTKYFGKNEDYHITMGSGDYVLSGSLTKKRLTFVATSISEEDFEFRFDGHFLRGGMVADAGRNEAVLKGRLIKIKDGVKVAEREVKFRVEYLGC